MPTGRRVIEAALRKPMTDLGWAQRASGWFTAPITPDVLGVVTVGVASEHADTGACLATLYLGVRHELVEPIVAALSGTADTYRDRTAVTTIGYLMSDPRWREWQVNDRTADSAAAEMVTAFRDYGLPRLSALAESADALITAAREHPAYSAQPVGGCRVAVLLATVGKPDEARELMDKRVAALGNRDDANAAHERAVAAKFTEWLRGNQHNDLGR